MVNQKLDSVLNFYYSRKDVQDAIFNFCKNREVVPRYREGFGKRPDTLEYPSDIIQQVKKGATSFHCSEEIWQNPLDLSTELEKENLDEIRRGWDLLIDIDSEYFDFSKIMARLILQALEFHGIKNIGIKFSGSKGFHLIIPWKAFPKKANGQDTCKMFPEWARIISLYIHEIVKPKLIERISELTSGNTGVGKYIRGKERIGDEAEKVAPDIVLVSSRHLFRVPYSLHEKTCLASIVLDKNELENFKPSDANPLKVKVRGYYPEARESEARELLLQALDWHKEYNEKKIKRKFEPVSIERNRIVFPPCVQNILKGMKDGKKRALFIMVNYLNSLNFTEHEITGKVEEWNSKNSPKLSSSYINGQLFYAFKHKKIMPPNCDKYYKDIKICNPDNLCEKIRNPLNYTLIKSKSP